MKVFPKFFIVRESLVFLRNKLPFFRFTFVKKKRSRVWLNYTFVTFTSGYVGRWVARLAMLVAHLLAMAALWVRIQTSPKHKIQNGIHKQRSGQHILARKKTYKTTTDCIKSYVREQDPLFEELKGVWHEIFDFRLLSWIRFSGPLSTPSEPIWIFKMASRRYNCTWRLFIDEATQYQ